MMFRFILCLSLASACLSMPQSPNHETMSEVESLITNVELMDNSSSRWLKMKKLTYLDPEGKQRNWEFCERTSRTDPCDAVFIVPLLKSQVEKDDPVLVLIEQFRPAVGKKVIEFPAGLVGNNLSVEKTAKKELKEETGYVAKSVLHVSPTMYNDPGLTNSNSQMVYLEIDKDAEVNKNPKPELEAGEFIKVITVKMNGLLKTLTEFESKGFAIDSRLMAFAFGAQKF